MKKRDILFYILTVLFVITIVITLLGVLKFIYIDEFYLRGLFVAFLIELAAAIYHIAKNGNLLSEEKDTVNSNTSVLEGVWGDAFKNGDEYRAAIIDIKLNSKGYVVTGFEYNEHQEEVAYWLSDVCIYRKSTGEFEYLFKAEEKIGKLRNFRGFTSLKFFPIESPTEYSGYFVDVYDTNDPEIKKTRWDPLDGVRLDTNVINAKPFSKEARKYFAAKLIQKKMEEQQENINNA